MTNACKPMDPSKPIIKIIIAGSRSLKGKGAEIKKALNDFTYHILKENNVVVINGLAPGPDRIGGEWAEENGLWQIYMPADWDGPAGNFAGHLRNVDMAKEGHATFIFWDGKSNGSATMLSASLIGGLRTTEIQMHEDDRVFINILSRGLNLWK